MKTLGDGGVAPPFLTLVLDGGKWLASHPDRLPPGKELGEPQGRSRSCRDAKKKKTLASTENRTPTVQPTVATPIEQSQLIKR
jgi:hypothetical protein